MSQSRAERGNVVVTGASSGIGEATVRVLHEAGFRVLAGVRKPEDGERLRSEIGDEVHPLTLDVASSESIDQAAHEVRRITDGQLAGLVNNAGVFFMLPLELMPEQNAREVFEVNVFGMLAVTRALLPMLRASRGRIIVVGSAAGRAAAPGSGMYSASKHAQEALVAALRMELAEAGVGATLVAPGVIRTPIWAKSQALAQQVAASLDPEQQRLYGPFLDRILKMTEAMGKGGIEPSRVADVIIQALTEKRLKARYSIGSESHFIDVLRFVPTTVRESMLRKQFKL